MTAAILSRRGPPQGSLRDEAKLVESHVPSLRMTAIRAPTARCLRHAHCAERYAARGKVVQGWMDVRERGCNMHWLYETVIRAIIIWCPLLWSHKPIVDLTITTFYVFLCMHQ